MPIDYTTARGQVRLLITDTDEADQLLSDAQVDAFLSMEGEVVKLAAAAALDVIASNEALVQKVTRLLDLQTNGAATAAELRKHAAQLRSQVDDEADTDGLFDWAEWVTNDATAIERIEAEALRGAL